MHSSIHTHEKITAKLQTRTDTQWINVSSAGKECLTIFLTPAIAQTLLEPLQEYLASLEQLPDDFLDTEIQEDEEACVGCGAHTIPECVCDVDPREGDEWL